MIRRILVCVDKAISTQAALSIATSLAGLARAELLGLFIQDERRFRHLSSTATLIGGTGLEPPIETPLPPEQMFKELERVEDEARISKDLFDDLCAEGNIRGTFINERGFPGERVVSYARRVDLVVLGSKNQEGVSFGSEDWKTVEQVLRTTTRPVLIVPGDVEGHNRALIAYDGSPAAERALRLAAEFSILTQMNDVHLLTVTEDEQSASDIQSSALDYLSAYGLTVTPAIRGGSVSGQILSYCNEHEISLLSLGAFGSNKWIDRIFGSTTAAVLKGCNTAVITVG